MRPLAWRVSSALRSVADIAQLVEQVIRNDQVISSSLIVGSISEPRAAPRPAGFSVVVDLIVGETALKLAAELQRVDFGAELATEKFEATADIEGLEEFLF